MSKQNPTLGIISSITGIFSSIFGSNQSEEERQYFILQSQLLGQQHNYFKSYVNNKLLFSTLRSFVLPILFFLTIFYLIYKNRI